MRAACMADGWMPGSADVHVTKNRKVISDRVSIMSVNADDSGHYKLQFNSGCPADDIFQRVY